MLCKSCGEVAVSLQGSCGIQPGCGRETMLQVVVDTCLVSTWEHWTWNWLPVLTKALAAGTLPQKACSAAELAARRAVASIPVRPLSVLAVPALHLLSKPLNCLK